MARELYEKVHEEWKDRPDKSTPVFGKDLMQIEEGIFQNSENKALKEIYGDTSVNMGRKDGTNTGMYSATFGQDVEASGMGAFAHGLSVKVSGQAATAEGFNTEASGAGSHAENYGTKAIGLHQHVQGRFNIPDSNLAHIVGNGNSDSNRSNAHTLDWNGNAWFAGDVATKSGSSLNAIGSPEIFDIDFSTYFT